MAKALNGRANCILEVCCPPGSAQQRAALAAEILDARILETEEERAAEPSIGRSRTDRALCAEQVAAWIAETFDLAPKGSLVAFKAEIARYAREPRTTKP